MILSHVEPILSCRWLTAPFPALVHTQSAMSKHWEKLETVVILQQYFDKLSESNGCGAVNVCNGVDCKQNDGRHVVVGSNTSSVVSVFHVTDQHISEFHEIVSHVCQMLLVR